MAEVLVSEKFVEMMQKCNCTYIPKGRWHSHRCASGLWRTNNSYTYFLWACVHDIEFRQIFFKIPGLEEYFEQNFDFQGLSESETVRQKARAIWKELLQQGTRLAIREALIDIKNKFTSGPKK